MFTKRVLRSLLLALAATTVVLPVHAGMVGTAQLQANPVAVELGNIAQQRDWIREQLVTGGVSEADAVKRVAALTDAQVNRIHQRMDEEPAGGADALVILILVLVITELMGYTDIIPNWPAE
ncbi:MAG: PA2779 family protein [Gammaproteobacteria bacterium]|nr:PA2779 family protein [Gammaproteobacteria bacterium]MDH3449206.1 PA2779 family protein [Gammaproteobacteria bacterium]